MRLVKLSVQRFQCIESAELEFGPGLNVLYGPNDIGKSSLAWAVRAVLLLQHNSTQHERFVAWQGGGEPPRVALTFVDAANRYWRVSKTFGGTVGRSSLETSKDGRTFSRDVEGRQVDEKVRKMLGWGVNAPGGKTSTRGIPDAFLIQVLLAEQDNVRKVLFESSLGDDPDESGRARLTEALGALAQDPMFKKILEKAQAQTDKAFTATGRKKKTATSPFVELDARIKDLEHEYEELETRVRETTLAEARIRELLARRDDLDRELQDERATMVALEKRHEAQRQRAELKAQIEVHEAAIRSADELRRNIESTEQALLVMQQEAEAIASRARDAAKHASELEGGRDQARARLDALTQGDAEGDRHRAQLVEAQLVAQESLHAAQRSAEQAATTLKQARDISAAFAEAVEAAAAATASASDAEQAAAAASDAEKRARQAVADAQQVLRDATSDDKARAKELRRAELQNRKLTRQSERAEHVATLDRIREIKEAVAKATAAEDALRNLTGDHEAAGKAVGADEAKLEAIDVTRASLLAQERYGQLRQLRAAFTTATRATEEAQQLRERASELRSEEAALRAKVRASVPTSETIAGLRSLRETLRIAEAQLAVGLSVAVRPKRPISIRSATDGAAEISTTTSEPTTLAAKQQVTLRIDDLVDIEISAGEESARAKASSLRDRWESEGGILLREFQLDTVEELEKLRLDNDANLRAADDRRREAESADQRGDQLLASAPRISEISTQIAELERELGAFDSTALESALARLGAGWEVAIKKALADAEQQRQRAVAAIDTSRQKLARLDAQLEAQTQATEAARVDATRLQAVVTDAAATETRATAALSEVDRDLIEIDKNLPSETEETSNEEQAARAAVDRAVTALKRAEQDLAQRTAAAGQARDGAVQATTRAEGVRTRARELDSSGVWTTALSNGARLDVDHWSLAFSGAEQGRIDAKAAVDEAARRLAELDRQRADAIQQARSSFDKADASARAARTSADELATTSQSKKDETNARRLTLGEMKTQAAGQNLEGAREAIAKLNTQLNAVGPPGELVEVSDLEHRRWSVERLESGFREAEQELAKARGALEQVGGAVVRERQAEIVQAIGQARAREREVAIEYDAWKLLVETLRETESAQGTNLGRALAEPVSARFRELTGGRYGRLEMGPHLESTGIQAAGDVREIDVLSAGTQDQLATLLRICVAEQLGSSIVLDDHLSQSDPERVGWFNSVLRGAAKQIQIVFITCRPSELLAAGELPAENDATKVAAAGLLHAIDLARVIKRFAAPPGRAAG